MEFVHRKQINLFYSNCDHTVTEMQCQALILSNPEEQMYTWHAWYKTGTGSSSTLVFIWLRGPYFSYQPQPCYWRTEFWYPKQALNCRTAWCKAMHILVISWASYISICSTWKGKLAYLDMQKSFMFLQLLTINIRKLADYISIIRSSTHLT